jgi:hypothetical protein
MPMASASIDQGAPDVLLAAMSDVAQQVPALSGPFRGPEGTSAPDRLTDGTSECRGTRIRPYLTVSVALANVSSEVSVIRA